MHDFELPPIPKVEAPKKFLEKILLPHLHQTMIQIINYLVQKNSL